MKHLKRWITWRYEEKPGADKPAKVPFDHRTGLRCDPLSPAQWMDHGEAVATGHSIGFVFVEDDGYFFLDLDGCREGDAWSAQATALVHRFPGAFVEVSVSGTGLHVVGHYEGPRPDHGTRCGAQGAELYTGERFMAWGERGTGDCETIHTDALRTLVAQYFPPTERITPSDWTSGPREDWTGPTDDDELIRKACASGGARSAFGGSASFAQLWHADADALGAAYPDPKEGRPWDASGADTALARHLAFWTGCDCERIERLMYRSALVRDKWEDRPGWLAGRISFAVAHTTGVYDRKPATAVVGAEVESERAGYQFLTIQGQLELFKGHIYVASRNCVMTPSGRLLKQAAFNASTTCYEFARDLDGKSTTRKPWEAFTESLGFDCPVADEACFDPTAGWGEPIERGGRTYANTYRPIETPRKPGDPTPFLTHLAKLLPDEGDRAIALAYMAAVVQHKGVKFQWCPVFQGVEGNGKTLLTRVLQRAIGDRYTHMAQSHDLASRFNSWLLGKILIGIEDIYAPGGRMEILEALKPMITNGDGIGIQAKGADQETARVCANFIINSNHTDAILKTANDRRFAVFFTGQQRWEDLARDGMHGYYFPKLYSWLNADGYAIVHNYLAEYAIPSAFNPAQDCQRAPATSSHDAAIAASMGPLGQEVLDWIDEGRPGFAGGWVSRTLLSKILAGQHSRATCNSVRRTLTELGYEWHPALDGGRTHRPVNPDGTKAELWVRRGTLAARLESPALVAKNYQECQREESIECSNSKMKV
jgi:hypothetical protein